MANRLSLQALFILAEVAFTFAVTVYGWGTSIYKADLQHKVRLTIEAQQS